MPKQTPNPGSEEATKQGCSCAVIDNHFGKGYAGQEGVFVYSAECSMHGFSEEEFLLPNHPLSTI